MKANTPINVVDSIELRVRFTRFSNASSEEIAERVKQYQSDNSLVYKIKQMDEHIWIEVPKKHKKLHSPQLHLEIFPKKNGTEISGLFGPDPSLWTMFMFLHFFLALIFIVAGIWSYSSWSLGKTFWPQLIIMLVLGLVWVGFYLFARFHRNKGKKQAYELQEVMNQLID